MKLETKIKQIKQVSEWNGMEKVFKEISLVSPSLAKEIKHHLLTQGKD